MSSNLINYAEQLAAVQRRIAQACQAAGRTVDSVRLLAVSKTFGLQNVLGLAACGQLAFGENYVQEAVEKHAQWLLQPERPIEWHFIGPLQSNKTRPIAQAFDWVQSIDRFKIAQRLNEQRPESLKPLQVCIQVNISAEASKSGCLPNEVLPMAQQISALKRLQLRGLMALPEAPQGRVVSQSLADQYQAMQEVYARLQQVHGASIDTLSMGMSADLEPAIAHGATMVRIGSALFGARH
jgi:PLP dependent protein